MVYQNRMIAEHSKLTTGIHGVTGNVVGTSDDQVLSAKSFSDMLEVLELQFDNPMGGDNPSLKQDASDWFPNLSLVAKLFVDGTILHSTGDLTFKSNTAFIGSFVHAITVNRTWTLPDVTGEILLIETLVKNQLNHQDIDLNLFEVSDGAPVLTDYSGSDTTIPYWSFVANTNRIRHKANIVAFKGCNRLQLRIKFNCAVGTSIIFKYSLNGGVVTTQSSVEGNGSWAIGEGSLLTVNSTDSVKWFLQRAGVDAISVRSIQVIHSKA